MLHRPDCSENSPVVNDAGVLLQEIEAESGAAHPKNDNHNSPKIFNNHFLFSVSSFSLLPLENHNY
jgi:hypothetical protein